MYNIPKTLKTTTYDHGGVCEELLDIHGNIISKTFIGKDGTKSLAILNVRDKDGRIIGNYKQDDHIFTLRTVDPEFPNMTKSIQRGNNIFISEVLVNTETRTITETEKFSADRFSTIDDITVATIIKDEYGRVIDCKKNSSIQGTERHTTEEFSIHPLSKDAITTKFTAEDKKNDQIVSSHIRLVEFQEYEHEKYTHVVMTTTNEDVITSTKKITEIIETFIMKPEFDHCEFKSHHGIVHSLNKNDGNKLRVDNQFYYAKNETHIINCLLMDESDRVVKSWSHIYNNEEISIDTRVQLTEYTYNDDSVLIGVKNEQDDYKIDIVSASVGDINTCITTKIDNKSMKLIERRDTLTMIRDGRKYEMVISYNDDSVLKRIFKYTPRNEYDVEDGDDIFSIAYSDMVVIYDGAYILDTPISILYEFDYASHIDNTYILSKEEYLIFDELDRLIKKVGVRETETIEYAEI